MYCHNVSQHMYISILLNTFCYAGIMFNVFSELYIMLIIIHAGMNLPGSWYKSEVHLTVQANICTVHLWTTSLKIISLQFLEITSMRFDGLHGFSGGNQLGSTDLKLSRHMKLTISLKYAGITIGRYILCQHNKADWDWYSLDFSF